MFYHHVKSSLIRLAPLEENMNPLVFWAQAPVELVNCNLDRRLGSILLLTCSGRSHNDKNPQHHFGKMYEFTSESMFENLLLYCDGNDVKEATTLDGSIEISENSVRFQEF